MKLRSITISGSICLAGTAWGGGLLLPGAGSISTSRAGAAVASADDGEALSINPAGIAKSKGTVITLGVTAIDYAMQFQRNGTYDPPDAMSAEVYPWDGQKYALQKNDAKPPLGFGAVQPVPLIAVVSDLGGKIPHLHVAAGLYAPNAYPFRDIATCPAGQSCYHYQFNSDFDKPPPPGRYDIVKQEAAVILPSIAVAYSILPQLDVGLRFSAGFASLKSTTNLWGVPANFREDVKADGQFSVDASDSFIPEIALGVSFRPTDNIELGARYTSELDIHAKGTASPTNGPAVSLNGQPIEIRPQADDLTRCAKGGTPDALKACVGLALPRTATVGGRYKFLDGRGKLRGDIELDVDWENWGKQCDPGDTGCVSPGAYQVTVDAKVAPVGSPPDAGLDLKDSVVQHGFRDTYAVRVGGSYVVGLGDSDIVLRGGLSYDTAAAKTHWERMDIDGAARTTVAAGASYRTSRFDINAGFGVILEGTRSDPRNCNPTATSLGCAGNNMDQPDNVRQGPDPIVPILDSTLQNENPVNQGTYQSHYIMFMLGASTWF
jgi:long-subunit fatty acid transport protein